MTEETNDGIVEDNRAEPVEAEVQTEADSGEVKAEDKPEENPEADQKEDDGGKSGDDWPTTARTAVRNRDRKIANLYKKLGELEAAQKTVEKQPETGAAPKEDDFDNYGDFLKAQIMHELQEKQGAEQQQPEQETNPQMQQYIAQKQMEMAAKAQEYTKNIPDYQEVLAENAEILSALPEHVTHAFLEADDGALAFYNLGKDGGLIELLDMPPVRAAMAIAQAQRPYQPAAPKPVHKPIKGNSGTSQGYKTLSNMSPDEIARKFNL